MEEERGLALFLEAGIFLGVLPPVASRSWHRCIADSAVLLVGHFECLLCNSPAFDLAYLSTSEVVPPSLVLHAAIEKGALFLLAECGFFSNGTQISGVPPAHGAWYLGCLSRFPSAP